MRKRLFCFIIIVVICLLSPGCSKPIDESVVLSSSEQIIEKWKQLMSGGLKLAEFEEGSNLWYTKRLILSGKLNYDVRKTDSLVSPYVLTLTFKVFENGNYGSPNANGYSENLNQKIGFKTGDDALANVELSDFTDISTLYNIEVNYALQKGVWILESGNSDFDILIKPLLKYKENSRISTQILSIPFQID
jgi:hypothetical protein